MDNYDISLPTTVGDFRKLTPAPTFVVSDNRISRIKQPTKVRFRDSSSRIRPVSPFFEVWASFDNDGELEPLTKAHLADLDIEPQEIKWRVNVGNLKAFRRTGDSNDKVLADTGEFSTHEAQTLVGTCANFKAGKSISFGSVQYLEPTDDFPEIRFRFTPAAGKVFGPDAGDPNIADDVYDRTKGGWDDHADGAPGTPAPTAPGNIYAGQLNSQTREWISNGYLDDACDGIIEASLEFNGKVLSSYARVSSGPPDFAPDSYPVRTVSDELEQAALGPKVEGPVQPQEAANILRRALETVRLMNTEVMNGNEPAGGSQRNRNNMAGQDVNSGRAFEPIFNPAITDPAAVRAFHAAALTGLENGTPPGFLDRLRHHDEVGDLTNQGRQKMPAMMRGSDGSHLALTRRQRDTIRAAAESSPGAGGTPEQDMAVLIAHFESRAVLHGGIDAGGGNKLSDLFTNSQAMMAYLQNAVAKGALAGAQGGAALIVPGDPDNSAFMQLIRRPGHPMQIPFSQAIPNTGHTGVEVVERWIRSLGV
ncbi:MAG: hypothetical protein P9E24_08570 [Candidatus Competibacter sp.]|nr:hypothetical protein [Candidatus Competibacter sp.]